MRVKKKKMRRRKFGKSADLRENNAQYKGHMNNANKGCN